MLKSELIEIISEKFPQLPTKDINTILSDNNTPLINTIMQQDKPSEDTTEAVKEMLEAKADPNFFGKTTSPLLSAIEKEDKDSGVIVINVGGQTTMLLHKL